MRRAFVASSLLLGVALCSREAAADNVLITDEARSHFSECGRRWRRSELGVQPFAEALSDERFAVPRAWPEGEAIEHVGRRIEIELPGGCRAATADSLGATTDLPSAALVLGTVARACALGWEHPKTEATSRSQVACCMVPSANAPRAAKSKGGEELASLASALRGE